MGIPHRIEDKHRIHALSNGLQLGSCDADRVSGPESPSASNRMIVRIRVRTITIGKTTLLGEERIASFDQLKHGQRRWKALVDRHHRDSKKSFEIGQPVLVFQTQLGAMSRKLQFRWMEPFWIIETFNDTFHLGTLAGETLKNWVNRFRLKSYHGPTPPNPFAKQEHG